MFYTSNIVVHRDVPQIPVSKCSPYRFVVCMEFFEVSNNYVTFDSILSCLTQYESTIVDTVTHTHETNFIQNSVTYDVICLFIYRQ